MKEAMLYNKIKDNYVQCDLCQHRCRIAEGKFGICGVRQNTGGILYSLVYGKAIATQTDPVEKKPMFHFQPGSKSFSIATVGCNFQCVFCQNSNIARMPGDQGRIAGEDFSPEEVVKAAIKNGCKNIAYTYTEPTVYFEYAYDTARIAHENGLKNIFVSNGYMTPEAIEKITPFLDGINVDLKAFDDNIYKKYMGGHLDRMLESIKALYNAGIWMEITTLIVPTLNDTIEQIAGIAKFIKNLSPDIPWHISRYHPSYKFTKAGPTPTAILHLAEKTGREKGLHYIYIGNVWGDAGENTVCWNCGTVLISRRGFCVIKNSITEGKCPNCATKIAGVDLSDN
jgi:pyruvate formate lyase activating enzyme